MNLLGSPALTIPEFAKYRQRAIVGLSLQVVPPLGQYDDDRYVNLGSNRWSFRPETGCGRVILEAAGGAWVFTHNENYVGRIQTQSPLYFAKANAIVTFRRGIWGAVSYGRATGGRTRVNGVETNSLQKRSARNDMADTDHAVVGHARRLYQRIVYAFWCRLRLVGDWGAIHMV